MLFQKDGVNMKYVCRFCGYDNIGKSGLGNSMVHCFSCVIDIPKSDCSVEVVTSELELSILCQDVEIRWPR